MKTIELKLGTFNFEDSLTQNSEGTNIAKLNSMVESEDKQQSSVLESKMLLRSLELGSLAIYCRK